MKCEICKNLIALSNMVPIHHFFNSIDTHTYYEYYYDSSVEPYINEMGFMCLCDNCYKSSRKILVHQNNILYTPIHISQQQYKDYYVQLIRKEGQFGKTV